MNIKRTVFSYFWQVLLAAASLITAFCIYRYNRLFMMMFVPFFMACFSILLTKKRDLDLSRFFFRRWAIVLANGAVALIAVIFPMIFIALAISGFLIVPVYIVLFINIRYIVSKSDDIYECMALTLTDPLHYFVSLMLVLYLEQLFY